MAAFTITPVARKIYDCATCVGKIQPGERYSRTTISPGDYDWGETDDWTTYITHLTPGQCLYEDSLLRPGEVNPCGIDNVSLTGGDVEGRSSTLIIDCACGAAIQAPPGGDEGQAVKEAFAAHAQERAR